MKYAIIALVIGVVGLIGLSTQPQETAATFHADTWPPLSETCADTNGDGYVDLLYDILGVIDRVYTSFGSGPNEFGYEYSMLYDVTGGGQIDLLFDVLGVIDARFQTCSKIDRQVVQATVATMKYANCQDAIADGYGSAQGNLYVEDMGIHISKRANLSTTFDLEKPFGLVCTEKPPEEGMPSGRPDKLIGLWYIIPVASTASVYNLSGPVQADDVMPIGFGDNNFDEDNPDPTLFFSGWHTHTNLCVAPGDLIELGPAPNAEWHEPDDPVHECRAHNNGQVLIPLYGWMLHLYNHIPNPMGRFMKWNTNPDLQQFVP